MGPEQVSRLEAENQRLRRAVEELSVLNELAAAIGGSRSSEEVVEQVVKKSVKTIGAEQGLVTLVDDTQVDPTQTYVRTVSSSGDRAILSPNQSLVGWMLLNKKPLILNSPHSDSRFGGTKWDPSIRSIICAPLLIHGKLLGVLTLYNKKRGEGFTEDDKRLLSILSLQSAQVLDAARLYEEEKKLTQIQEQLRLARTIQMRLLPNEMPQIEGYDIAGTSKPAQSVGGDLFDVVQVEPDFVAFWIGDVSGKGLPASLTMANTQAVLRTNAMARIDPAKCISRTDELLCQYTPKSTFVTGVVGCFDPATGKCEYSNAGHVKPIVIRNHGQSVERLETSSLVMGFNASIPRTSEMTNLASGDTLFLCTDGIDEAMNEHRQLFDDDNAIDFLKQNHHLSASDQVEGIVSMVNQFASGVPQTDDITLLIVKRN
ncbi:MAG: SpoIIE family protein phosphatase [Rhodothermales bacterium]|nr:SpoIIE family protein phosphatase [Rhodothermales bacterium]